MIAPEKRAWVESHFAWAVANFGQDSLSAAPLITPTRTFFKSNRAAAAETAQRVFSEVKSLLSLDSVDVSLIPQGILPEQAARDYNSLTQVSGSFIADSKTPIITYDPRLLDHPIVFISTMAHELMHLKLADVVEDMPGGRATHELATDLHCVIHGFGIFQLDAADRMGWAGYLSQDTRAFALAVFLQLTNRPVDAALPFLSAHVGKKLRKMAAALSATPMGFSA
ncbi:MAG: hypothetical protein CFE33_11770 [Pseudorhodobacter sp. PARRP1]|nr:MAG: hypothetical protein CFE33_11770 [Pseudorhodobacter sp. PARRP1]